MRFTRYARLISIFAGASLSVGLEYRANFVVNVLESLLRACGAILGLSILFADGFGVGGWTRPEATVLVGIFTLVSGIMGAIIYPNLRRIAEAVRTGSMDFTLLKPVDAQFLVSTREFDVFRAPDILIGLALAIWAGAQLPGVTAGNVLIAAALLIGSMAIVYALCFMLATSAFWFVRVENTLELFWGLYNAGQFPITAFPGWVRWLFTFVVPIAFITTVPAEAVIGRANSASVLGTALVALVLLVVSRWFWRFAVRNYTSASS